jgi:hypothetical protein
MRAFKDTQLRRDASALRSKPDQDIERRRRIALGALGALVGLFAQGGLPAALRRTDWNRRVQDLA